LIYLFKRKWLQGLLSIT